MHTAVVGTRISLLIASGVLPKAEIEPLFLLFALAATAALMNVSRKVQPSSSAQPVTGDLERLQILNEHLIESDNPYCGMYCIVL